MTRLLLLILFIAQALSAQNIRIFDSDVSNYPYVKSKIVIVNNSGEQLVDLNSDVLEIIEDGIETEVLELSCEPPSPPDLLSAVLAIDISGSMEGEGIELAKTGAKTWINSMLDGFETSIIGFSDFPILYSDYSQNIIELDFIIDELNLLGGTNVQRAFMDKNKGAIATASRAVNKPIIILLSDGIASIETNEIINAANELNAKIYSIVLFNKASSQLREISNSTGGFVYDDVSTKFEIIQIYRTIFEIAQQETQCTVEWLSKSCNLDRNLKISYADTLFGRSEYIVEENQLPQLEYPTGEFLVFDDVEKGEEGFRVLSLQAGYFDIEITKINSSNPFFTVDFPKEDDLPLTISEGESENIRIKFNYQSDNFEISEFEVVSNACLQEKFYASGGKATGIPGLNAVEVLFPNGGEVFASNSSNTVLWSGTLPEENVRVEFSDDKGNNWSLVNENANNLRQDIDFPDTESDSCLIRITQFNSEFGDIYLEVNTDNVNVNAIDWSNEGNRILSANVDGKIRILNSYNGIKETEIDAHSDEVKDVKWSPDGIRFASVSLDGKLKFWNSIVFDLIEEKDAHDKGANTIDWSSNGNLIATGGNDNIVKIWNSADFSLITELNYHNQEVNSVKFSPNNEYLASCGNDSLIKIFDTNSWDQISSWKAEISDIRDIDWVNNGELISVSDRDDRNYLKHWDINGNLIKQLEVQGQNYAVAVNRERNLVAFGGLTGRTYLHNIDDFSEEINYGQKNIYTVQDVDWSPEGTRFANGIYGGILGNKTIQFFSIDRFPTAVDQSDSVFSLKRPSIKISDLNLGKHPVDLTKENDFFGVFQNNNELEINITEILLENNDNNIFDINPDIIDGNINKIKAFFTPEDDIEYTSNIKYVTNAGEFKGKIIGEGVIPDLNSDKINFGDVIVGKSESRTISLLNNSELDLNINNIDFIGASSQVFEVDILENQTSVPTNEEIKFQISYNPDNIGIDNSVIGIEHNGENSPATIELFGSGIQPDLELSINDTLFTKCYKSNTFNLIIENTGIGEATFSIANSLNLLELNKNELTLNDNNSTTISFELPYNLADELEINIESDFGDFSKTLTIKNLVTDFELSEGQINFFQNSENQFETNTVSVVNIGETELQITQSFPIQLEGGLLNINYSGSDIINAGETAELVIEFQGDVFGSSGTQIINFSDVCENSDQLEINWNVQDPSDPIIINDRFIDTLICANSKTYSLDIANISNDDIVIEEIYFRNGIFNLNSFPAQLDQNSISSIVISFDSDIAGTFDDELIIEYSDYSKTVNIQVVKEIISYSFLRNNYNIDLTNSNNTDIEVINTGSLPININNGNIINDFEIQNINFNPIAPNQTAIINIAYVGNSPNYQNYFTLETICGSLDTTQINVIKTQSNILELTIPDIEGNIGDVINIPINIYSNFAYDSLSFSIEYNKTLLEYIGDNPSETILNNEIVYFENINNSITELSEFRILWGNDSTSNIEINDINLVTDEEYFSDTENGLLRVLDLCYEGGVRLYFAPDFIIDAGPNPSDGTLNLNYYSKDERIINVKLLSLINSNIKYSKNFDIQGEGTLLLNFDGVESGSYLLEVVTNNYSKNIKLIINP